MKRIIFLAAILFLGFLLRFNNLNWDNNFHLHPDERFLTMVGVASRVPETLSNYLDPATSIIKPANFGFKFFVYGIFPITINKIAAVLLNNDTYNAFAIQGRALAALADLFIIILIFKTVLILEKKYKINSSIKYWASFFYAIAVLPIQLSHFFTVDSFLNFFMFVSFYFSLRFNFERKIKYLVFGGIFLGFALSSKITAFFILPLNLGLIGSLGQIRLIRPISLIRRIVSYLLIVYLVLRIGNPYYFQSANFLDPRPDAMFMESIKTLGSFSRPEVWYPPAVQWVHKIPIVFALINIAVFGVGILYFIFVILGVFIIFLKVRKLEFSLILFWVLFFVLYQSTQFSQTMRYFIFIYPFFAIFAASGIEYLIRKLNSNHSKRVSSLSSIFHLPSSIFHVLFIFLLLLWPFMFSSIYINKHTRVEASEWIYKNIPNNSLILGEYWDDPLPIPIAQAYGKSFQVELLPVFDPDTKEKWQKMNELLSKADYYILSSNRGWGSVTTVPEKYPRMSEFYNDLLVPCYLERSERSSERSEHNNAWLDFSVASPLRNDDGCDNLVLGKYKFKKIKEFNSFPSLCFVFRVLCFITFPDNWSEEAFTVYDHPQVMIFKREK